MAENRETGIRIDLNAFKLHIRIPDRMELSLHFTSASRKFYLSVIALVVMEMKKQGKVTSVPLSEHYPVLALLNRTVGGGAGSSAVGSLIPRIYRKWKGALPDLEHAPLFRVLGRKKGYEDGAGRVYGLSDENKDLWANLFEYKGSEQNVRLRFSVDKVGLGLDDVVITYGEDQRLTDGPAWEAFLLRLQKSSKAERVPADIRHSPLKVWRRLPYMGIGKTPVLVVGFALILAVAVTLMWVALSREKPAGSQLAAGKVLSLPDKPSIAVMPFENLTGDPTQDYLADGITENIITVLSQISELFVISRNSTLTYKGKPVKVQKVAEDLGVRYVLEGSVHKSGDRLRVNSQLIDATKGHHLWSDRYDRRMEELFALQDDITKEIVLILQVKLTHGEQARIWHRDTNSLEAWGKYVRAYSLFERYTKADNEKARELFEEAVKLDPEYATAWTMLAYTHFLDARYGFSKSRSQSFKKAVELAHKSSALDKNQPLVHSLIGCVYLFQRQYDQAIAAGEKAIELGPNNSEVHVILALIAQNAGDRERGIRLVKKAMRLAPYYPPWYLNVLGVSYCMSGKQEKAIAPLRNAIERFKKHGGNVIISMLLLMHVYVELGRVEEARALAVEVLRINPKFSLESRRKSLFFKNPADSERHLDALRKAGLK